MIGSFESIREVIERINRELDIPGDAELFRVHVIPRYERCELYSDCLCLRKQSGNDECRSEETCRYRINPN